MSNEIIRPNFTISDAAKAVLADIRQKMALSSPEDPPEVSSVAWGTFHDKSSGKTHENVVLGFYPKSMHARIAHGISTVSGINIVFFVTKETATHFAGKILDFDSWFFLRDP